MSRKTLTGESQAPSGQSPPEDRNVPRWPLDDMAANWMGLPWMNMWMQSWFAWLQQFERNVSGLASQATPSRADDRRQAPLPWVPQFDSTVVPLRRRDDLPGSEATKVSMRLHVPAFPWTGAHSNVIAIDTLMPQPVETSGAPRAKSR